MNADVCLLCCAMLCWLNVLCCVHRAVHSDRQMCNTHLKHAETTRNLVSTTKAEIVPLACKPSLTFPAEFTAAAVFTP